MAMPANLLADIPAHLEHESLETILTTANLRIERIISRGHSSPQGFWYDQRTPEWVMLLSGAARLRFEGEEPIEMTPGSYVHIPEHRRHRVEWTHADQPTVWLAIHYTSPD
jgi:cupin 2 domain-containing protein